MDISTSLASTFLFRASKFLFIFSIVFYAASITECRLKKKRLLGVTIIGSLIATGAIYDLFKFIDWDYYRYTFQHLPDQMIAIRYGFSLFWRVVVLVVSIRLLCLDSLARKSMIVLAWVQIVTIFWKHPVYVFENLALQIQQQSLPGSVQLVNPWIPWFAFLFFSVFDIIISAIIIYFLSRPLIKKNFESLKESGGV